MFRRHRLEEHGLAGLIGVALFTIGAAEVDSNVLAVACITLAMMSGAMCSGRYWALAGAIAPTNCAASTFCQGAG